MRGEGISGLISECAPANARNFARGCGAAGMRGTSNKSVDKEEFGPSMRNLLDKTRAAQRLDGNRLTGSLRFPVTGIICGQSAVRKLRGSALSCLDFSEAPAI